MQDETPIEITLRNTTIERLGLSQTPWHWPESGKFAFELGFANWPSIGDPDEAMRRRGIERFEACRKVLGDDQDDFVHAICLAAIVRRMSNGAPRFDVFVNGVRIMTMGARLTPRYERRLKLRKINTPITTASALIYGGGKRASDGALRGYEVMLDQPAMPWRPR